MAGRAGMKGGGGARPGAGRKPAPSKKRRGKAFQTDDPDEFLRAVMRDPKSDFKDRMAAALALKKSPGGSPATGKRERQQQAARDVVRPALSPLPAPRRPRLVAVK